jgi:hypothetical protein
MREANCERRSLFDWFDARYSKSDFRTQCATVPRARDTVSGR